MCHMFQTICSMFYTLSIALFTLLKTLILPHLRGDDQNCPHSLSHLRGDDQNCPRTLILPLLLGPCLGFFWNISCFDLSNLGLIFIELPCRFIRTIPYDIQNLKQMWAMFGANKVLVLSISAIYLLLLARNGLNFH